MGTAPLAAVVLRRLAQTAACEIPAVVTRPDRPQGRSLQCLPSAVKTAALELRLPVWQPEKAREPAFIEQLKAAKPDIIIVTAYGQILPQTILDIPPYGCLNVHASLLPRWRGAAPIQWALLSGDTQTGVTIMKMDAGLDTGDILSMAATPITDSDNAVTLHDRLAQMGAELLVATLPDWLAGKIAPQKQPAEGVTIARKITKEDGRADWTLPASSLRNRLRAFIPWPGLYTRLPADAAGKPGALLKIWEATVENSAGTKPGEILRADGHGIVVACGQDALRITILQKEGGRRLSARDFLAGHPLHQGQLLW